MVPNDKTTTPTASFQQQTNQSSAFCIVVISIVIPSSTRAVDASHLLSKEFKRKLAEGGM